VDYFRAHVTTAMKIRFHKILGISWVAERMGLLKKRSDSCG
jgi:hypothetical protein